MRTQTKKVSKLLVACIAAFIAISIVAIAPMFAHAEDPVDPVGEDVTPVSSGPSIEWNSANYADSISVPIGASITFSYTFTYTLTCTDNGADHTYTNQWTVDDKTAGYVDGPDGYRTWTYTPAYSTFVDSESKTVSFSTVGKHTATLVRKITPGAGVTDNLASRGAMNRKDLSVDSAAASNYEKYSLDIYASTLVDSKYQPSHVIVWDTLAHSEETVSHKTVAKYGGYYAMPGGNLTITRNAPESSFADTDARTYTIKLYDLSRRGKTCEALTVPAKLYKSDTTTDTVNFVFNANSPEAVIENTGTVDLKPNEKIVIANGKLNAGTTYDIICNDVKDDHYHAASASTTLNGASFSNIKWPLGQIMSIVYGSALPAQGTETTGVTNNATVTGITDGSYANVVFDCQTVTPTGFMINNSPYIALILIPAGLICAWFVYRRKKNHTQA